MLNLVRMLTHGQVASSESRGGGGELSLSLGKPPLGAERNLRQ